MSMAASLAAELDHEIATTRKMLERLPENKLDWRPRPKSMTLGHLASHVAEVTSWTTAIVELDSYDLAPPDGPSYTPPNDKTRADVLRRLDENAKVARVKIAAANDAAWSKPWTLLKRGTTIFSLPRGAALRAMIFSHLVHHRGQLSVYLRMNDVPLPQVYGPTADEQM